MQSIKQQCRHGHIIRDQERICANCGLVLGPIIKNTSQYYSTDPFGDKERACNEIFHFCKLTKVGNYLECFELPSSRQWFRLRAIDRSSHGHFRVTRERLITIREMTAAKL